MGIGLIFIIWILVGAMFLAKLAPVRELVTKLRHEPVLVQWWLYSYSVEHSYMQAPKRTS